MYHLRLKTLQYPVHGKKKVLEHFKRDQPTDARDYMIRETHQVHTSILRSKPYVPSIPNIVSLKSPNS